ncbi:hypothetical protein JB92DRAFT_3140163 [Gautieria morchelliformis]|nr:hypothetical protein JB92DRAFT_3140163 [Gautieria morchelliformis]
MLAPSAIIFLGKECSAASLSALEETARHWLSHAMREIVRIEGGEMEMSHATIINTEARMLVASRFRTPCPHSPCRKRASYYRPEGLADHLTTCSAGPGIPPPSYEVAKQVAHELMAELVRYDQEVFRSMYEGAVWRILHAI